MDTLDLPPFEPSDPGKKKKHLSLPGHPPHHQQTGHQHDPQPEAPDTIPWFTTDASASGDAVFGVLADNPPERPPHHPVHAGHDVLAGREQHHQPPYGAHQVHHVAQPERSPRTSFSVPSIQSTLPPWEEGSRPNLVFNEEPEAVLRPVPAYQQFEQSIERRPSAAREQPSPSSLSQSPSVLNSAERRTLLQTPSYTHSVSSTSAAEQPAPKFCTRCGFKNGVDSNFCGNCGLQLIKSPVFPDLPSTDFYSLSSEFHTAMSLQEPEARYDEESRNLHITPHATSQEAPCRQDQPCPQDRVHPVIGFGFGGRLVCTFPMRQSLYSASTKTYSTVHKPGFVFLSNIDDQCSLPKSGMVFGPFHDGTRPKDVAKGLHGLNVQDARNGLLVKLLANALDHQGQVMCRKNEELLRATFRIDDLPVAAPDCPPSTTALRRLFSGDLQSGFTELLQGKSFSTAFALCGAVGKDAFGTALNAFASTACPSLQLLLAFTIPNLRIDMQEHVEEWRMATALFIEYHSKNAAARSLLEDLATGLVAKNDPQTASLLYILAGANRAIVCDGDPLQADLLSELNEYVLKLAGALQSPNPGVQQCKMRIAEYLADCAEHGKAVSYCKQLCQYEGTRKRAEILRDRLEHSSMRSKEAPKVPSASSTSIWDKFNPDAIMSKMIGESDGPSKLDEKVPTRPLYSPHSNKPATAAAGPHQPVPSPSVGYGTDYSSSYDYQQQSESSFAAADPRVGSPVSYGQSHYNQPSSYEQPVHQGYPVQPMHQGHPVQPIQQTHLPDDQPFDQPPQQPPQQQQQQQHPAPGKADDKKGGGSMFSLLRSFISSSSSSAPSAASSGPAAQTAQPATSPIRANLGEQSKFRFDEHLKRWVEEGGAESDSRAPVVPTFPPRPVMPTSTPAHYGSIKKHFDPFNLSGTGSPSSEDARQAYDGHSRGGHPPSHPNPPSHPPQSADTNTLF